MNKIIVLGGGMVGSAMAIDLAKKHHVLLTDVDPSALEKAKEKCEELNTLQLELLFSRLPLFQHSEKFSINNDPRFLKNSNLL